MAASFTSLGLRVIALLAAACAVVPLAAIGLESSDRWTAAETAVLASMTLAALPAVPGDPSNAVESDPRAIELGRRLFFDTRLSSNGQVACATCHAPDKQFQDGLPLGKGVGTGARRTMPIAAAAYSPWLFWDGRKDSLWSQALGPLEDPAEHGGNRLQYAHILGERHRAAYESVFGPMPNLAGLPRNASPVGDRPLQDAWNAIPPARRDDINRMFANLGKAIAAYERTIQYQPSRFDRYVAAVQERDAGGMRVMSPQEVNGLRLFIGKGQCSTCHNGPLFSDQAFHNTGVPPRDPARPDRGRAQATARVIADEFNCLGRYSDAPPDACTELRFIAGDDPSMEGAFRTPSLRNVTLRAPYMHAGQIATLEDVIAHYVRSPAAAVGHSELAHKGKGHAERQPIRLSEQEAKDLAAFLRSLNGEVDGATLAAAR